MTTGTRNWLLLAGIMVVTLVLAAVVGRRYQATKFSPTPTTFNAAPHGLKAVYVTLERLGHSVARWELPWTRLPGQRGILIYTGGLPSDEEQQSLARWVAQGNTFVVYAVPGSSDERALDTLWSKLGLRPESVSTNSCSTCRPRRSDDYATLFNFRPRESTTLRGVLPATFTRGVARLNVPAHDGFSFDEGAGVTVVVGEEQKRHTLWLRHELGHVLIFSSPAFIDNQFVGEADNFTLLLGILRELGGAGNSVLFDEFHHGYSKEFNAHDFLALPMVKLAAAQLALLIGLLIWSNWRRFGVPVPLTRESHRSVLEYAVALGDLYARAETQLETLEYLYGHLRRELADRHGLRADANAAEIAARLDTRPETRQQWEQLARDCEHHLQTRRLKRAQFGQLAQRLQEFRRQLR